MRKGKGKQKKQTRPIVQLYYPATRAPGGVGRTSTTVTGAPTTAEKAAQVDTDDIDR
jgi:hypothetical protein